MKIINNASGFLKLAESVRANNKHLPVLKEFQEAGDLEGERAYLADITEKWGERAMGCFDFQLDIVGRENIPDTPCVFISNHQSYFDVFALFNAAAPHQTGFVAKEEFEKVPLLGTWVLATRGVFIKRGDARESLKSIQEGAELIKQGFSMAIFPEGTRSRGPEMGPFKAGSFKLATKAKVPVVPVAIDGTYHAFEETGEFRKGQRATITFLPAQPTVGVSRSELAEMPEKVENMIREHLGLGPAPKKEPEEES